MLSLTMHEKDYLTINGDIVVQIYQISKNQCRISIKHILSLIETP